MIRYGYCCINSTLRKQNIYTGRTLIKRRFQAGGLQLISDLALQNANDLLTILKWNVDKGIKLFRVGSELFPRWNEYELIDVPDFDKISNILFRIGEYARNHKIRLTTHPGPFHILGSPNPDVVNNSIVSLERHSELFDLMGYEPSYENAINIHIGSAYNDKEATTKRWIQNYNRLSDNLKKRLVIENDDKESLYSVKELYNMIHVYTNIPITFDYWHHTFHTSGLSEEEAFELARTTWLKHNVTQMCHISQSRRHELLTTVVGLLKHYNVDIDSVDQLNDDIVANYPVIQKYYNEFKKVRKQAHSDYIITFPKTYGVVELDIDVEAKAKELALERLEIYT